MGRPRRTECPDSAASPRSTSLTASFRASSFTLRPAAALFPGAAPGNTSAMPDVVSLIRVKRDNERALSEAEIGWLFGAYLAGEIADEQMAALLMAIYFNGLDGAELRAWTGEMIASGERLDLSATARPTVDKHSTGGVGDKVSLILAPLVASCGAAVPMLSGRGLAHTGGTLDKLVTIPGFRVDLVNIDMRV